MLYKTYIIILIFFLLSVFKSNAQIFVNKEKQVERFEAGAPVFSPLIMPSYTPEMGLAISTGGLLTFKTRRNNPYIGHSVLPVILGVSTKGAFYSRVFFSSFWIDDRLRFNTDLWFENMKDNYWGIGYEKAKNTKKGESTTEYHKNWLKISPSLLIKLSTNFFGGLKVDLNRTIAGDISEVMLEDPHILEYGTNILNTGLGFTLNYDSRDLPSNAWKGMLVKIDGLFYNEKLGGDYTYKAYELDYRQYINIMRQGTILAWRVNSRVTAGQVPWTDMSKLGSLNDLRGYYWGQYRDKSMALAIIEYRHTFNKKGSVNLSRHGIVIWLGSGTVFENTTEINSTIINLGAGYRFALQPRMNLRIDIGFGEETAGLYVSLNEAF